MIVIFWYVPLTKRCPCPWEYKPIGKKENEALWDSRPVVNLMGTSNIVRVFATSISTLISGTSGTKGTTSVIREQLNLTVKMTNEPGSNSVLDDTRPFSLSKASQWERLEEQHRHAPSVSFYWNFAEMTFNFFFFTENRCLATVPSGIKNRFSIIPGPNRGTGES
jgi:hypothetical protein